MKTGLLGIFVFIVGLGSVVGCNDPAKQPSDDDDSQGSVTPSEIETSCSDLRDNDLDGDLDCEDPDCDGDPACIISGCSAPSEAATCENAIELGLITAGAANETQPVNLVIDGSQEVWVHASFDALPTRPAGTARALFMINPGDPYRIDVVESCGAPMVCGGVQEWSFYDEPSCCSVPGNDQQPFPTGMYFRVYGVAEANDCRSFVLQVQYSL